VLDALLTTLESSTETDIRDKDLEALTGLPRRAIQRALHFLQHTLKAISRTRGDGRRVIALLLRLAAEREATKAAREARAAAAAKRPSSSSSEKPPSERAVMAKRTLFEVRSAGWEVVKVGEDKVEVRRPEGARDISEELRQRYAQYKWEIKAIVLRE
jgi:hypothetical protein